MEPHACGKQAAAESIWTIVPRERRKKGMNIWQNGEEIGDEHSSHFEEVGFDGWDGVLCAYDVNNTAHKTGLYT